MNNDSPLKTTAQTLEKNHVVCSSCKSEIAFDALVCRYCQRDQSNWFRYINRIGGLIAILGLIGTLIGSYIAITSASEAKSDRKL